MTSVRVRVPATSANLGPGFDALGLALALHNEALLAPADSVSVTIEGEGAECLDRGADNVIVRGARAVFELVGRPFTGLRVSCVNRIPPGRGLGSSAAAWVSGIAGANALLGEPLDRPALLDLAARLEGHPDNVAAAVLGGLTVACWSDGDRVAVVSLPVPPEIAWVVLIPEEEASTADARAVLPPSVPRADAVFNLQRVGLFLGGLQSRRFDLLGVAMDDRLHQPYRRRLFPWMEAVIAAAREAGALGCVLSGAGPSLLAAAGSARGVGEAMERALSRAGLRGVARSLEVDPTGAVWETRQGS